MNLPWDWQVVQSKASGDSWPSCSENQHHCLYKTMFENPNHAIMHRWNDFWIFSFLEKFPPSYFRMISFLCVLPRMSYRTVIYGKIIFFKDNSIHFHWMILEYFENNSNHVHLSILENNSNHFNLRIFEYFGK